MERVASGRVRGRHSQRDRIPNRFGTALAHLVRQREGASSICSHNFEPTIRGTALR